MQGQVCLVTGATAGIGLVTARELARKGAHVILVGRSSERCSRAADEIRAGAGATSVEWLVADLSVAGGNPAARRGGAAAERSAWTFWSTTPAAFS